MLDERAADSLSIAAYGADPEYVPAAMALEMAVGDRLPTTARRRLFISHAKAVRATGRCWAVLTGVRPGRIDESVSELADVERRFGSSACTRVVHALLVAQLPLARRPIDFVRREWPGALALGGTSGSLWGAYVQCLLDSGDSTGADAALRRVIARTPDWRYRVQFLFRLEQIRTARGDSVGARLAREQRDVFLRRDDRPGVRAFAWLFEAGELPLTMAEPLYHDAQRLALAHGARYQAAHAYIDQCAYAAEMSEVARALPICRTAVGMADSTGSSKLRVDSRFRLGRAYVKAGQWRLAVSILRRALELVDRDDLYYRAQLHHNLAHAYESAGRYGDAVKQVNEFASIAATLVSDDISTISLYDAGMIRWKAGLHSSARSALDSMVAYVDERQKNFFYAGRYYEMIGNLPRALAYYRLQRRHDTEEGARALAGLVRVYEALGMADSAESAARAHDREFQTPEEIPLMPRVLVARGRTVQALAIERAWSDSQVARGNVDGATAAELEVAGMLLDHGATSAALVAARRADSLARYSTLLDAPAQAHRLAGEAQLRAGRSAAALATLLEAEALARRHGSADEIVEIEISLGDAYRAMEKPERALAAYDVAAAQIERMTTPFEQDLDRVRFHATQLAAFDRATELVLSLPPSAVNEDLLMRWSQRRKRLAYPHAVSGEPRDLVGNGERLSTVQHRLRADQVLVDYILVDSIAAAMIVSRTDARVVRLPARPADIARDVKAVRRPVATAYMGQVDLARANFDQAALARLSAALIRPIGRYLSGTKLLVVPDGALHLLPFDLLQVAPHDLLIDRYAVSLLPSTAFLRVDGRTRPAAGARSLLFVRDDVPGGAEELAAVQRIWPASRFQAIRATTATESSIRSAISRYDILHFATHAEANANDPLASRLILHRDGTPGGELQVAEIEKTPSHADLVVLSACVTAEGQVYAGAGPLGLARAFLVSGSNSVLATLWPVGASTADLMKVFYERLAAGDAPADALRAAKQALRSRPETRHPFHWAGFVLVGDATAPVAHAAR